MASSFNLRIRCSEGNKSLTISSNASLQQLVSQISELLGTSNLELFRDQQRKEKISINSLPLTKNRIQNKDVIFVSHKSKRRELTEVKAEIKAEVKDDVEGRSALSLAGPNEIVEDPVDQILRAMDGRLFRERTENCRHNSKSKCIHCISLEPFEMTQNIKHMSFHSYLRQLAAGMDKGKYASLKDTSCSIKSGCKEHPPWPKGICSKCQPAAITLNRQSYRHVDNIMFENPNIVETFLSYWRKTGNQRMGFLYGKHEVYLDVPLGIKTVVCAIYEPPQKSSKDSIELLEGSEEENERVNAIGKKLGLLRVGWIFTDLLPNKSGGVKCLRHGESHYLTAQECISAAFYQLESPNKCKESRSNGVFGSKFVTIVVSGDKDNNIMMEGYQVSNQCMALVRDSILFPTKDASDLGWIPESLPHKYIPDVYYSETDKYGNTVSRIARPLPVLYLLVNVSVSSPKEPLYSFSSKRQPSFPVENRCTDNDNDDEDSQNFSVFSKFFSSFTSTSEETKMEEFFCDFHILLFLGQLDVYPLYEHMDSLLDAIATKNSDAILAWTKSEHWQTLEMLIDAHNNGYK